MSIGSMYYTLGPDNIPVPCDDLIEWAIWFGTNKRVVEQTDIDGMARVSTVFLGIDHSFNPAPDDDPILFETMVFFAKDGEDHYQERYSFWPEAEAGHKRVVEAFTKMVQESKEISRVALQIALHEVYE